MQKYYCKKCNKNWFTSRVNETEKCPICQNQLDMMDDLETNCKVKQLERDILDSFKSEK